MGTKLGIPHTTNQLSDVIRSASFTQPAPFTYGTARRNILTGPGLVGTDFLVFKNFPIRELGTG